MQNKEKKHYSYYIKRYLFEVLEAFVALSVLHYMKYNKITMTTLKMALGVGLITLILEEYNSNFSSNIKSGMTFTVGSSMVGG